MNDGIKYGFEIKDPSTYRLACAIWPHLEELKYEEIKNDLLVFNSDGDGVMALFGPGAARETFELIEPDITVTFSRLTKK